MDCVTALGELISTRIFLVITSLMVTAISHKGQLVVVPHDSSLITTPTLSPFVFACRVESNLPFTTLMPQGATNILVKHKLDTNDAAFGRDVDSHAYFLTHMHMQELAQIIK